MDKPIVFPDQCPTCDYQKHMPKCGGGKARANQTSEGTYYKNVDCVLWRERRIVPVTPQVKLCPTCGQVVMEEIPDGKSVGTDNGLCLPIKGYTADANVPIGDQDIMEVPQDISKDISLGDESVLEVGEVETEVTKPVKPKRIKRRGFKDMPRAKPHTF